MSRPSAIVISDWLANCQAGQWTPFEAATALKAALAKEGYTIVAVGSASTEGAELDIAREIVCENPSVSYLQRKMQITYNHACRLMGLLETEGAVSTPSASGVRTVLHSPQVNPEVRHD